MLSRPAKQTVAFSMVALPVHSAAEGAVAAREFAGAADGDRLASRLCADTDEEERQKESASTAAGRFRKGNARCIA